MTHVGVIQRLTIGIPSAAFGLGGESKDVANTMPDVYGGRTATRNLNGVDGNFFFCAFVRWFTRVVRQTGALHEVEQVQLRIVGPARTAIGLARQYSSHTRSHVKDSIVLYPVEQGDHHTHTQGFVRHIPSAAAAIIS